MISKIMNRYNESSFFLYLFFSHLSFHKSVIKDPNIWYDGLLYKMHDDERTDNEIYDELYDECKKYLEKFRNKSATIYKETGLYVVADLSQYPSTLPMPYLPTYSQVILPHPGFIQDSYTNDKNNDDKNNENQSDKDD